MKAVYHIKSSMQALYSPLNWKEGDLWFYLLSILDFPICLTCMFLDCGRKLENLERTRPDSGRTCQLRTRRKGPGLAQGSSLAAVRQQRLTLLHLISPFGKFSNSKYRVGGCFHDKIHRDPWRRKAEKRSRIIQCFINKAHELNSNKGSITK